MKKFLALLFLTSSAFAAEPELSRDIGVWKPELGQCTQEQHDAYSYVDPVSGDKYVVWHPELDPLTECSFGHSHLGIPFVMHEVPSTPLPNKYSIYMSIWKPTKTGECTMEEHDAYNVVGPDDLLFPTWHAAVEKRADGTTCFFGHEHGQDPRLSVIFKPEYMPCFGCVNYIHTKQNVMGHRHEDHVGHKVAVGNRIRFGFTGSTITTVCDMIIKLHQGTHSKDAFTNNLHEQTEVARCDDGSFADIAILSIYGKAGGLKEVGKTLDSEFIPVGAAVPSDSPSAGGERIIPTVNTVVNLRSQYASGTTSNSGMQENWRTGMNVWTSATTRVNFTNYWSVSNPARYYDPSKPDGFARTIDSCQEKDAAGAFIVQTESCNGVRSFSPPITWDDPRSPFRGDIRGLRVDSFLFLNAGGPTVVYTDAFGNNPSLTEFPGSVRQEVSSNTSAVYNPPTNRTGFSLRGGTPSVTRQPGVHAPN